MNWSDMSHEEKLREANDFFDLKQMQKWVMMKGKKVTSSTKEPKPFKSGLKVNTVKDVIEPPILHTPAFTFEEDDSYVE